MAFSDPIATWTALAEKFEQGKWPRATLILASSRGNAETFFGEEILRLVKKRLATDADCHLFLHDAEAEEFRLEALCDDLRSASLFGGKKFVVVRRADSLCRSSSRDGKEATTFERALLSFLAQNSQPVSVLVLFEKVHPESPLPIEAAKHKAILFEARKLYASPPPWMDSGAQSVTELERWVRARASTRKLNLKPEQVRAVAKLCGAELAQVEQELEKLALLSPEQRETHLAATLKQMEETSPSDLVSAILDGECKLAFQRLNSLVENGFSDWGGKRLSGTALYPILMARFTQDLGSLLRIRLRLDSGETLTGCLSELKLKPFQEKKWAERLRRFSSAKLRELQACLLEIETQLKRGRLSDPRLAFERFLFSFETSALERVS